MKVDVAFIVFTSTFSFQVLKMSTSLSSPPFRSHLPLHSSASSLSCSLYVSPLRVCCAKPTTSPPSPFLVLSYKSRNGTANEARRELLEQYGLNPDEFLSEPPPKNKRRKEGQKGEISKQFVAEEPKPPRSTHKLLQVLGGTARRKKLLSPQGMDVRPMMEVVKGAAFDILQAAGGCPASLRPGRWLDLYSGTGSVGIEALSRGCSEVHFVEMDPWVVSDVLRPNLQHTGFLDVSIVHPVRVENFIERAEQFVGKDGPFDYISVTPPYTEVAYAVLMDKISKSALIGQDTFIVVEYALRTDMLESCGHLVKITDRRFGRTLLAIYGPKWAEKKKKKKRD